MSAPVGASRTTESQHAAIHARGVNVCVAAGAGSGKTFVLVERFVELVRSGADPREVLTITFTERAAREMRERIAKELASLPGAPAGLEGAWISTIHGFCARLLRTYAVEADVDPAFTILRDLPLARVRRAAFAEAQAAFRAESPEAYGAIVDRVRWGRDEDGFAGIDLRVFSLHETLRSAGVRPRRAAPGPFALDVDRALVTEARARVAAALAAYHAAAGAVPRLTAPAHEKVERVTALVDELDPVLDGPFTPAAHRAIQAVVKAVRGNGLMKEERDDLEAALQGLAGAWVEGPARAVGAALDDLVARFDAAYRARKAELAALDFGDLEERARELLEGRPDVCEDVRQRFAAILVDEFQDTSRLQQRLVALVRRPDAFFAVGDVKQAIYGFRHAEVKGLLEVERDVKATGGLVVPLDTSFRTRPSVLAYVDAVFEPIFGDPASEVPHQPLRPARNVAFTEKSAPSVEVLLAHGEALEHGRAAEARGIAARLASIVEGKLLEGTNPLKKATFGQPLRYRDCAILFRAMTELPVYERALRERGVPYRVDRGGGFFEAPEVVDALALLRCVASSRDDLALATVLRSPVVGLPDDALLALATLGERDAAGAQASRSEGWLARALRSLGDAPAGSLPEDERGRALRFAAVLESLRAARGRVRTRDLLARALEETGLGEASLLRSGNVRGFANLTKLLEIVGELESDPSLGLEAVIFALDDLRASGAREGEVSLSGGDEDAVLLLTVHGAKGLEWPLVVVADLGRADNPWSDPVMWSEETGSVPVLGDPGNPNGRLEPRAYGRLVHARRSREREESKRLLYVAMTRACDHLILAGARGGSREAGPWLAWALGPLNVAAAPLATEPDEAMGAVARKIPGPDPRGVRFVALGTRPQDAEREALERPPAPRPSERILAGPLGPEAGARTLLDASARERLSRGLPPALGAPGHLEAAELAEAALVLARAQRPLPVADLGASSYVVTEVLGYEACPRLYLYEQVVGAKGDPFARADGSADADELSRDDGQDDGPAAPPLVDDPALIARNVLGRATHRVLELGPARSLALARGILAEETGGVLSAAGLGAAARLVLEWVTRFERSPLGARTAHAAEVRREEPFLVRVPLGPGEAAETVLLRGTADLVLLEDAGTARRTVLVDYKTNDLTALEVPARARSYALQLQLYALALATALGEPVTEAWLSFLAADQSVSVDVSAPALEAARERLARFVLARRRGDFTARPSSLCRTCAFRAVCPAAEAAVRSKAPELVSAV
jgi:ATP-dependent exoDNAse (exonuclease V) beta subunit